MAIPVYNDMFYDCLRFFKDNQPHHVKEIRQHLATVFQLSKEEIEQLLPSGSQRTFENRCGWCTSYLYRAGLLLKVARGTYQISNEGIKCLNNCCDNASLVNSVNQLLNSADGKIVVDDPVLNSNAQTPDEQMASIHNEIRVKLASELLANIKEKSSVFFEQMVVKLLERMGYGGYDSSVTQPSKDGGIDGIINEDKLGFGKIYIQAKKWDISQTIGRPEIQKFAGALHENNASKGLFITTAKFSSDARDSAKKNNIILVDGEKLASLMIEYDFGVSTERVYKIKRIDSDFFSDNED